MQDMMERANSKSVVLGRWMKSGVPKTAPVSALKCVAPLMSPEGCFHATIKVVSLVLM